MEFVASVTIELKKYEKLKAIEKEHKKIVGDIKKSITKNNGKEYYEVNLDVACCKIESIIRSTVEMNGYEILNKVNFIKEEE